MSRSDWVVFANDMFEYVDKIRTIKSESVVDIVQFLLVVQIKVQGSPEDLLANRILEHSDNASSCRKDF